VAKPTIVKRYINSTQNLWWDAVALHDASRLDSRNQTSFARSAALMYVLFLEALINRVFEEKLPSTPLKAMVWKDEKGTSTEDKYRWVTLLTDKPDAFKPGQRPWSQLQELFRFRNDYVHPKADRVSYHVSDGGPVRPLEWRKSRAWGIDENDVVYRETQLPKDPDCFTPEHADAVQRIAISIIKELDSVFDGGVYGGHWLESFKQEAVEPNPPKANKFM